MGQVESDPEDRLHPGDVQESSPLGGDEGKLGESFYIPQLPNPTSAELSLKNKGVSSRESPAACLVGHILCGRGYSHMYGGGLHARLHRGLEVDNTSPKLLTGSHKGDQTVLGPKICFK